MAGGQGGYPCRKADSDLTDGEFIQHGAQDVGKIRLGQLQTVDRQTGHAIGVRDFLTDALRFLAVWIA